MVAISFSKDRTLFQSRVTSLPSSVWTTSWKTCKHTVTGWYAS